MRFKVPQNVDIEDKIIGPLTGKQFLWFLGGGVLLFLLWKLVDFSLFIFFAVIIMGIMAAFAFVRPYQQSMVVFLGNVFLYSSKGKKYLWRKEQKVPGPQKLSTKKEEAPFVIVKKFSYKEAEKLAQKIDSQEN